MSEEQETTGGSLKNILIGLVSTVTLGVGGFITNKLTGDDEGAKTEVAAPAPVINITNSNQQSQQAAAGGKTVIIRDKAAPASAPTQQTAPAPVKKEKTETEKRKEEGLEW
jgi:hypothetical protein